MIDKSQWILAEKSRWLYTYLIGTLNTELHTETINIESKKGFGVYRQICNIVDAVPENYKSYLDSQFAAMPQVYGDKV